MNSYTYFRPEVGQEGIKESFRVVSAQEISDQIEEDFV